MGAKRVFGTLLSPRALTFSCKISILLENASSIVCAHLRKRQEVGGDRWQYGASAHLEFFIKNFSVNCRRSTSTNHISVQTFLRTLLTDMFIIELN